MEVMKKHFVLVHGACHGSWCWYKLKPLLEAAGHKVTSLDMEASGIDLRKIEELRTLYFEKTPKKNWFDTQFVSYGSPEEPLTSMFFGPKFLAQQLYQLCSPEDVALASSLVRPSSLFIEDLSKVKYFTDEGYGSVKKQWLIDNIGTVIEAKEIKGADHMAMLCTPKQLCDTLLEIDHKYN
ncbi:hypothetical protein R3W88_004889 [Solanum pinnatisectum]|uniref:Salicylic acid-binding protein 2 n=1 Tax=Solanum pinnatisectum TaxID=50273 RepID=A0AAV9KB13_9SOLN|nr:hypothetical protein R3W88_004889 [Solanum pinnatisectum]